MQDQVSIRLGPELRSRPGPSFPQKLQVKINVDFEVRNSKVLHLDEKF